MNHNTKVGKENIYHKFKFKKIKSTRNLQEIF